MARAAALPRLVAALLAAAAGCGGPLVADGGADADLGEDAGADGGADADGEPPPVERTDLCLLVDEGDARRVREAGRSFFGHALAEVLAHAGLTHRRLDRAELDAAGPRCAVLVLAYDAPLSPAEAEAAGEVARGGGTLVAVAGTSGLDELLGVERAAAVAEGWVALDGASLEPPPLPLHAFDLATVTATTATPAGGLVDPGGVPTGEIALTRREVGRGEAWLLGPDLGATVVRIRQGLSVVADGTPAPDGSAPVDDGILKTDDGIALDYERDRGTVDGHALFLEPVVDEWVRILLQVVVRGAARAGASLPLLWYWPGDLDAVGVLSHDSDGNDPALARALLAVLREAGVESTFCFMRYPETYPPELFAEVASAGIEVALHYDARTPGNPETTWSEANLLSQLAWLEAASGLEVATNKNHYLRWEGWAEFYRWCEAAGLEADQSRGPSKGGNVGFPFGSSHPSFPLDDAERENRVIDVLAVDLLTQDLVHTCPYAVGPALVDRAVRHHGVAHFLFHPAHVERPGVAEALADIVAYGRAAGMEWWTVRRLSDWERARRRVVLEAMGGGRFVASTPDGLPSASLILTGVPDDAEVRVGGLAVPHRPVEVHGSPAARLTVDLAPGATEVTVSRP